MAPGRFRQRWGVPRSVGLPHIPAMLRTSSARGLQAWALAWALTTAPAAAQLRPLDPLDWADLERSGRTLEMGGGIMSGQRASLAGTEGRLLELGAFRAVWRIDRVALELSGTAFRIFDDRVVFADPVGGTARADGTSRTDVGDYRVATTVRLSGADARVGAALRFGVRLPTTDNAKGLGRDQTDFFSTLATRVRAGAWDVRAEAGLSVNGTRDPENEQIDPFLFALSAVADLGRVDPVVELVGQHDPRAAPEPRGTENLGEARLGIRVGEAHWIRVMLIRGWTRMGPEAGLSVRLGTRF